MSCLVKFCGICRQEDLQAAIELGVDYVGFILVPGTPRYLQEAQLHSLLQEGTAPAKTVLVTSDLPLPEIERLLAKFKPAVIQLHGNETADYCRQIRGVELWKALHLRSSADLQAAMQYPVDRLLLDAAKPGSGMSCDWKLAAKICAQRSCFLAGGINPDNAQNAWHQSGDCGLDIGSGIEKSPGTKDHDKMRRLMENIRRH
jgi:phosphoribosylanthranilate isomerase